MDRLERRQRRLDAEAGVGNVDIGEIMPILSKEKMVTAISCLLSEVGYEMLPVEQVGGATPDFRARRTEGAVTYEVLGVLCMKPDESKSCYDKMTEMEGVLGDGSEYVMAVHQMPEYLMYDMLEANKGKLYMDMKDKLFMMWICYSTKEGDGAWCFLGGSKDKALEKRFSWVRQLTAEAVVGPRITDMLMAEELEDF
ncbi:MAG: hypothetical protein HYX90_01605 [Chloroflexi bacterium]|nr:hypothetical protein [Chloroflexota bacterium]